MILSSQILKSAGTYRTNFPGINLGYIKGTQAAIDFYKEQARAKLTFDTNQRKNDEFWEAVENLTSYLDWHTGDLDLPTSVWKAKCKKNPEFFELDCIHGTNCNRINSCKCIPDTNKRQLNRHKKKEVSRY
jgi:hypothetical protein